MKNKKKQSMSNVAKVNSIFGQLDSIENSFMSPMNEEVEASIEKLREELNNLRELLEEESILRG